jgi:hypothetical protein
MKIKLKIKVKVEISNQREVVRVAHIRSLVQGDTSLCWNLVLGVVFVLCQFTFYQKIDIPVCG